MQIVFIVIFALIFIFNILCIFIFRKYNCDFIRQIDNKTLSIRFVLGFASKCTDLVQSLSIIRKSRAYENTKQRLSALNINAPADKNVYIHHLKLASYIITIVLISSFIGIAYTASQLGTSNALITELSRPSSGEGSQNISLITDSEAYSGTIEINIDEKEYSFDEVMDIFSSYRADFDTYVLGDNASFLHVTSPLNLPSTWGDENIRISWYISDVDIVDFSGNIISDNLSEDGSSVEIIATLTLGDISADICYQVKVFPTLPTDRDLLTSYVNDYINSDSNRSDDTISLPSEYNGQAVSFFEENEVYPSMDFSARHCFSAYSDCSHRKAEH